MWLINSSIGRKLIMSISGLFLILFLLFHMSMNLVAVYSAEAYDMICGALGANWYALAGTAVLAGGFIVHVVYATILTLKNQKARGEQGYAYTNAPKEVSFASRNMGVLGSIVLLGLLLHMAMFWYKMQFAEIIGCHDVELGDQIVSPTAGAAFIQYYFAQPVVCIIYLIWFAAIWFHLTHGFWSALHTIGWNNKIWFERLKCISKIFATVICLGFAVVVIAAYINSLGLCA